MADSKFKVVDGDDNGRELIERAQADWEVFKDTFDQRRLDGELFDDLVSAAGLLLKVCKSDTRPEIAVTRAWLESMGFAAMVGAATCRRAEVLIAGVSRS